VPVFELLSQSRAVDARVLDAMLPEARIAMERELPFPTAREIRLRRVQKELNSNGNSRNRRAAAGRARSDRLRGSGLPDSATSAKWNCWWSRIHSFEAIHIATSNGAAFLGELDTIGTSRGENG